MDATITNASSESIFLPGPNLDIPAGESKTWSSVTVADMDGNPVLKAYVVAGSLTVSLAPGSEDAAQATQGALNAAALPIYTVANLPTGYEGRLAFASNGRKTGEGAGSGTGVPVYFSDSAWRTFPADAAVTV